LSLSISLNDEEFQWVLFVKRQGRERERERKGERLKERSLLGTSILVVLLPAPLPSFLEMCRDGCRKGGRKNSKAFDKRKIPKCVRGGKGKVEPEKHSTKHPESNHETAEIIHSDRQHKHNDTRQKSKIDTIIINIIIKYLHIPIKTK
jgi:hypothetical protein